MEDVPKSGFLKDFWKSSREKDRRFSDERSTKDETNSSRTTFDLPASHIEHGDIQESVWEIFAA
jgi:hypothetical protein